MPRRSFFHRKPIPWYIVSSKNISACAGFLLGFFLSGLLFTTELIPPDVEIGECKGKGPSLPAEVHPSVTFGTYSDNATAGVSRTDAGCEALVLSEYTHYAAAVKKTVDMRNTRGSLRIAAFTRLWIPPLHPAGGMQYHAFHTYSQLALRGHYVHVFVTGPLEGPLKRLAYCIDPETHQTKVCDSVDAHLVVQQVGSVHNREYSMEWMENCIKEFRKYHEKEPFHIVHTESWAAVPNIVQLGLPFAVTWHGSMLDWFRNELNRVVYKYRTEYKFPGKAVIERMKQIAGVIPLEAYSLLTVPQHIVISDVAKEELIKVHHIPSERIELIYNGVDREMFQMRDGQETRRAFLDKYGIPHEHYVVGCAGRLASEKGHRQLSGAMRLIMKEYKNVTLIVAGKGIMLPLYRSMQEEGFSVVCLGMLDQTNLAQFYRVLDVFVDAFFQHHGLNTVMIEAALSGVPLVVTDVGSARSVVPCTDYGRLAVLGDLRGLVREILYYQSHIEEGKRAASRCRQRAMALFGSDTMAIRYENLFYRMLEKPVPLEDIRGVVKCTSVFPSICYRTPGSADE